MENDAWHSALSMSVDESGAIYITGDHIGAADFNPTNEENILTPSGISDLYIASYSPDGNYNWAMQTGSELDEVGFSLDVDDFGIIYLLQIFDITGRVVKTLVDDFVQPGAHETQWDASDQASGVYFVWLESGTVVQTQKIVLVK